MGLDNTALPFFVTAALENWYAGQIPETMEGMRATDVLMGFNGDKSALASALAGTDDKKSTAYKSQYRNIGRWLKSESGTEGQKRKPSKAAQEKFKTLTKKKHAPKNANFVISGTIAYSSDVRDRIVGADRQGINLSGKDLALFLDNIEKGNIQDAYAQLFDAYGVSGMVMQDDTEIDMDISFS